MKEQEIVLQAMRVKGQVQVFPKKGLGFDFPDAKVGHPYLFSWKEDSQELELIPNRDIFLYPVKGKKFKNSNLLFTVKRKGDTWEGVFQYSIPGIPKGTPIITYDDEEVTLILGDLKETFPAPVKKTMQEIAGRGYTFFEVFDAINKAFFEKKTWRSPEELPPPLRFAWQAETGKILPLHFSFYGKSLWTAIMKLMALVIEKNEGGYKAPSNFIFNF